MSKIIKIKPKSAINPNIVSEVTPQNVIYCFSINNSKKKKQITYLFEINMYRYEVKAQSRCEWVRDWGCANIHFSRLLYVMRLRVSLLHVRCGENRGFAWPVICVSFCACPKREHPLLATPGFMCPHALWLGISMKSV